VRVNLLARQAAAELLGTAGLVAVAVAVVGSGVAASRLSPSDTGLQLLENDLVTGAGPVALILAFGPISGGHSNRGSPRSRRVLPGRGRHAHRGLGGRRPEGQDVDTVRRIVADLDTRVRTLLGEVALKLTLPPSVLHR